MQASFPSRRKAWRWYYQPDLQAIRVTLGTMKAHYLKIGDPAWLFVVAPPGTGKTTLTIMGMAQIAGGRITGRLHTEYLSQRLLQSA